jgi:putative phosphonate metabolism protein
MRYAIYFTPSSDAALWRLGSSILGYDAVTRATVDFPSGSLWREPWFARAQATPARYGFHATLKAPFSLAAGVTESAILERAEAVSTRHAPVFLPALEATLLGDFVALRPLADDAELSRLAAACVRDFDDLRAPLASHDRERRLSQGLTPRQHAHLEQWGYPYVFEDFRFHMTLTGSIAPSKRAEVLATMRALYRCDSGPVVVDAISVLAQPTREERFGLIARFPLRGSVPAISLDR